MAISDFAFGFEVDGSGGSAVIVRLTGELDLAGAPSLRDCLVALVADDIVIDMTGLTFLDCSGISVLVEAHKRAVQHGRTVVLRRPQGIVARVLDLSGVDEGFAIEPSVLVRATAGDALGEHAGSERSSRTDRTTSSTATSPSAADPLGSGHVCPGGDQQLAGTVVEGAGSDRPGGVTDRPPT